MAGESKGQANADVSLAHAESYFKDQDWGRSEAAAKQALQLNPQLVGALVIAALAETNQGKVGEAEGHLRAAAGLAPRDPRVRSYLGSTLLRQQRFREARTEFEKVLQIDRNNLVANYNLGLIAMGEHQPSEAARWFRRGWQCWNVSWCSNKKPPGSRACGPLIRYLRRKTRSVLGWRRL